VTKITESTHESSKKLRFKAVVPKPRPRLLDQNLSLITPSDLAESRALKRRTVASASRCASPLTPHPRDVVADFVVALVVAHCLSPLCIADGSAAAPQSDRPWPVSGTNNILSGICFTLAIEHTSAYMSDITGLTLGASG
jgi:hypothetical protein